MSSIGVTLITTANNGTGARPSAATDGIATADLGADWDELQILASKDSGTGDQSVAAVELHGYVASLDRWFKIDDIANPVTVGDGTGLADALGLAYRFQQVAGFDRIGVKWGPVTGGGAVQFHAMVRMQ